MGKLKKYTIILMSVITTIILCALPIMSTYLSDGESCTMFIRGYNLMEFSAWGSIPLFASLLIPVIIFGYQTKSAKEAELLLLLIGNIVCYVHGFNVSQAWLSSLGGSLLRYYPGMLLYPCLFIATWVAAWFYNREHNAEKRLTGMKVAEE